MTTPQHEKLAMDLVNAEHETKRLEKDIANLEQRNALLKAEHPAMNAQTYSGEVWRLITTTGYKKATLVRGNPRNIILLH